MPDYFPFIKNTNAVNIPIPRLKSTLETHYRFFVNNENIGTLKIVYKNIQGFISKQDLLTVAIYDLSNNNQNPIDIICLFETFISRGHETIKKKMNGYCLGTSFCRRKKIQRNPRGGVYILYGNSAEVKELPFVK